MNPCERPLNYNIRVKRKFVKKLTPPLCPFFKSAIKQSNELRFASQTVSQHHEPTSELLPVEFIWHQFSLSSGHASYATCLTEGNILQGRFRVVWNERVYDNVNGKKVAKLFTKLICSCVQRYDSMTYVLWILIRTKNTPTLGWKIF